MKVSMMRKRLRAESAANKKAMLALFRDSAKNVSLAGKLAARLNRLKLENEASAFVGASGKIYLDLHMDVDSFKAPELVRALEAAMEVLGEEEVSSSDYPEYNNRDYSIRSKGTGVNIKIGAYLKGEGTPSCRRIEVGEEIVTVKKYEFRCD